VTGMSHRSLSILVVDDHVESAFMMAEVFKRAGHTVRTAVGGLEAIREAFADHPDAIVMDINLPDLGGFEAGKRIKTLMPDMKMIGISGLVIPPDRAGDLVIFEERLQKPTTAEQLLAALDRLFEHSPS
jgi:CheY-like chemotaxis protein